MAKLTSKQYRNKLSTALGVIDDIERYCDQEKAPCIASCEDLEDLLIDVIFRAVKPRSFSFVDVRLQTKPA